MTTPIMKPSVGQCLSLVMALLLMGLLVGCDSNDSDDSENFSIVGTWVITEVEGAPGPVDASNSTWTFQPNGTYDWFFAYPGFFDLQGSGSYALNGSVLSVTGVVANTVVSEAPDGRVTLTLGANTFSFRDDDNDRWVYVKR